jgi:hypothetical protein
MPMTAADNQDYSQKVIWLQHLPARLQKYDVDYGDVES